MLDEMPDSTKELLTVHHAAIIRELDSLSRGLRGDISDLRVDMAGARTRLEAHNAEDAVRFGHIDRGLSVLQWAYGLAVVAMGAMLVKIFKW